MDLDEIIKGRRSIRKFKKKKVSRKLINKIIEAGKYAPSACNMQMWHFIVVDDDKIKNKLCSEANCSHVIKDSSFTIFVLYDKTTTPYHYANIQSAAAAIQNMLLKSYSLGIGSLWTCAYGNEKKIRRILKIPENFLLIATVCFGNAAEKPKCPIRREDVISYNVFEKVFSYPSSFNPKEWTIEEIKNFQSFKIRAKSPFSPEHKPIIKGEFKKVLDEIEYLKGKVLDVFPYSSNYTYGLLIQNKIQNLSVCEMSDEVINFIRLKLGPINKKIRFIKGLDTFPIENRFFDVVMCFNGLERVPNPEKIVQEIHRVLKKGGSLYLLFTNKNSFHGIIYVLYSVLKKVNFLYFLFKSFFYSIYTPFGLEDISVSVPFRPLSYKEVKNALKKFRIEKSLGIGLFPKLCLREFVTTSFLKNYCKTILIKAVKE